MQAVDRIVSWHVGPWRCAMRASLIVPDDVPLLSLAMEVPAALFDHLDEDQRREYAAGRDAAIESLTDTLAAFCDQVAAGEAAHQQVH